MRFSLQDCKKSIQRRGSELFVSLHFLRRDELQSEIAHLITYYEALLGQPQHQFSLDDARAYVGDYRLAHCLLATLSHWYVWRQCEWTEALLQRSIASLPDDIASSIQLRLALYTYVNEHYQGFLDTQRRAEVLQAFAEHYQLPVSDLEYLLALDTEDEAILVRTTSQPPEPHEVATLYNQWAFEAALFNASNVRFIIDCRAFAHASSTAFETTPVSTGVGAVIKRLCYLARKIGVYYDLAYDTSVVTTPPLLTLTLYGPQEVTGAAQQYGIRLARLCRLLLSYATHTDAERSKKNAKAVFSNSIVEASATVHFLQRTYSFSMGTNVLYAIRATQYREDTSSGSPYEERLPKQAEESSSIYDSSIEQSFAEAFSALAHGQGVDGWRLEREPEPLLLPNSIFIPDFALTRTQRRIYVEILGFWTPSYRERKIQKLHYLQERDDLLLAIPIEAKEAFTSIAALFPIVYYDGQLSATEVISVLRSRYDDFAERLALLDVPAVQERIMHEQMLSERVCYEVLSCYRRSELQMAVERIVNQRIAFAPGFGLYERAWMEQLKQSFVTWMTEKTVCSLAEALQELRARWPLLAQCEDEALEALLATWQEVEVQRSSIFDAQVALVGSQFIAPAPPALIPAIAERQEKKQVRERRATLKRRTDVEVVQTDLWG